MLERWAWHWGHLIRDCRYTDCVLYSVVFSANSGNEIALMVLPKEQDDLQFVSHTPPLLLVAVTSCGSHSLSLICSQCQLVHYLHYHLPFLPFCKPTTFFKVVRSITFLWQYIVVKLPSLFQLYPQYTEGRVGEFTSGDERVIIRDIPIVVGSGSSMPEEAGSEGEGRQPLGLYSFRGSGSSLDNTHSNSSSEQLPQVCF